MLRTEMLMVLCTVCLAAASARGEIAAERIVRLDEYVAREAAWTGVVGPGHEQLEAENAAAIAA